MSDSAVPAIISPKRILVVDDAVNVAEALRMMLSHHGHKVETSGTGEEALSKFESGKYDLVITDYSMPKMNGIELARAIKKRSAGQLVLLLTAFAFSIAATYAQRLPVDFILGKPFSPQEFEEAMAALFSAKKQAV